MGADSILVTAAFKYGASQAEADVPDMSNLIEGQREISKTYVSGVLDIFKSIREEEDTLDKARDAQLRAFKVAAAKAKKHLLDNEQAQPMKVHDAIYDKFKSLEQEFISYNTVEENDNEFNEKMRANLYAQLSVISNQAVEARGTIATKAMMADFIVGDDASLQDIAIARAIMGVDGNYENIELSFNKKGQLVYHVQLPGMTKAASWTIEDFNKKIIIHDLNIDTYTQRAQNAAYKRGLETKQDFNYDELKSNYLKTIIKNDELIFRDITFSEINGKQSWRKSLSENPEIAKASIEYLFTEDMLGKIGLGDVTGDGIVDIDDLNKMAGADNTINKADLNDLSDEAKILWKQNIQLIIDALTNHENLAFDFSKSADALADYFVSDLEKDYFNDGRRDQKPKGGGGGAKIYTIGDSTYQFEYPASGAVERRQRASVIRAIEGRDKIFIWQGEQKPAIEFKKVEGGYQEQGEPGDWGYRDEERIDPYPQPNVISLDDFILQYGGSQQPILTSGSGYKKASVIIEGLEAKDPKDMSTTELRMKVKNGTASKEEELEWMRRYGKQLKKVKR